MEVAALNERLRDAFSALLKLLPPPHSVSALCASPARAGERYARHCRLMLWRLNSYQYGSASAFLLDLEQLERAAEAAETQQQVQRLRGRLAVSEGERQAPDDGVRVANCRGATVSLRGGGGVPGLQQVASTGARTQETEPQTAWLCNVSLKDQVTTVGSFSTEQDARKGYEEQRLRMAENAEGFVKLRQLAAKLQAEQREEEKRVLREAMAQCHPRLTTMKVTAVVPPASAAPSAVAPPRALPRSVARSLAAPASSSPAASPPPSEAGASPPRPSRASKRQKTESSGSALSTKKQTVESASNSTASGSSAGNRSYLKLRRLIQKRLCRHLKGKEVCVLSNPDKIEETRLRASGRLEAGKVYSFRRKKQMTFADFVRDELGRAESACAHMYLVRTKESIDDHLKVCDAFSDKERELGQSSRSRRTSRRR